METTKDWKFLGRILAFIPAGLAAGICVRLAADLLRRFFAWQNPPSEFGNSFVEGGLMYLAFGTETGRLYTFLLYSFISEIVAAVATILILLIIFPYQNSKVFSRITFAVLFFYAFMLFMNFISLPRPSVFDVFIIKLFGGLCGALVVRYSLREMKFEN